jgi:hypothetical protein
MVAALCIVGVGCDIDGESFPDAFQPSDAGVGLMTWGEFDVLEGVDVGADSAQPFVSIEGRIGDIDLRRLYQQTDQAGSCKLLTLRQVATCGGTCETLCVEDDQCIDPVLMSAGRVEIHGLLAAVDMVEQPDHSYAPAGPLPDDLFSSEANVVLDAYGGELPWFSLGTAGTRALNSDLAQTTTVLPGDADLVITWPDPDASALITLELYATRQYPAQPPPAMIRCMESDDGQLIVPARLLAVFPEANADCLTVDCPKARLRRGHSDTVISGGVPIELLVAHEVRFPIDHRAL